MAKLGGDKTILSDIRTHFSVTPGGKVIDLSNGIQFYIKANGTTGIGAIRENVTQRVLTSSASPNFNDYGSNSNFPIRFSSTSGFTVPLLDPEAYPSYLKQEQTVAFFVGNISDSDYPGVGYPRWSLASPNIWTNLGGLTRVRKYPEDRINNSFTSGSASGSYMLTKAILFTSASLTTGSYTVAVTPFLAVPRKVPTDENHEEISTKIIPVMTYRDWILDAQYGIKLRSADVVACGLMLNRDENVPDIVLEQFDVGNQHAYERVIDRGRNEKRLDPVSLSGASFFSSTLFPRNMKTTGWNPNAGGDEFHLVVFRQRLGSTTTGDPGFMDMSIDGEVCYHQRGYQDVPEGASRFTIEDLLTSKGNLAGAIPGNIQAIGRNPTVMGLGPYSYGFVAGWNRCIDDDEIVALTKAMYDGVYTNETTSTTAQVLSNGYGSLANDHYLDSSIHVTSLEVTKTSGEKLSGFVEKNVTNTSGSVTVKIPIITKDDPSNLGIAYRNHGDSKVGSTSFDNNGTARAGSGRIKSKGSTSVIHGARISTRLANVDGAFGPSNYQISKLWELSYGSSKSSSPTGNVGTGFLYYSPFKNSWIEKRPSHTTHRNNKGDTNYLLLNESQQNGTVVAAEISGTEAVNVLEYNNDTPSNETTRTKLTFHVTGANRILSQFAGSPNVGYLLPWKEILDSQGYGKIGWPTSTWGAPADAKYHAFDDESIKLDDFIDRPFVLKSIELDIDIEAARMFVTQSATNVAGNGHAETWARYIMNRRDIESYSFFVYRQRRRGGVIKDSTQDISSSERFLIASASIALYNSASFGGSYKDQYWLSSSIYSSSLSPTSDPGESLLRSLLYQSASFLPTSSYTIPDVTPIQVPLTRWTEPTHGPAFSYNWGVSFTDQTWPTMTTRLKVAMTPSVVPYGITVPSLMTFAGGKLGNYTTQSNGFRNDHAGNSRPAWPHTGVFADPFPTAGGHIGSGTYAYPVIHFWHGSTRIPQIFVTGSKSNRAATRDLINFYGTDFEVTSSTNVQIAPYQVPKSSFASAYTSLTPAFSQYAFYTPSPDSKIEVPENLNFVTDGRAFSSPTRSPGKAQPQNSIVSQAISSNTNLLSYWKAGVKGTGAIIPDITLSEVKIQTTEYLLLPTDELVLGLENSNFATPDFGPLFASGAYKDVVLDYLPFSYLRVLPGVGEIRLIGRYLRDDEAYYPQSSITGDASTVIGDIPYDQYNVTETDGYYGGIFDEIITGSTDLTSTPLRGVAGHATTGDIKGNFSLNRFFTVYTDRFVRDYYDDGLRDTLRTGETKNQFKIRQKAVLSSVHYGYLRDFLETPQNQVLAPRTNDTPFNDSTVTVKFIEKSSTQFNDVNEFQKSQTSPLSVKGSITTSQNVSRNSTLDGPYKDGQFTDRDAIEYTVTV
jgi:hypothetical protein